MPQLIIKIKDKIAKPLNNCVICDNSDYTVKFIFDEEWEKEPLRIARFIWNKQYVDVQFTGDTCEVPVISKTNNLAIGVYAGDLRTTTPAILVCHMSILSEDVIEHSVTPSEYEEIMKLLSAQATDIAALKAVDKRIWTQIDNIDKKASLAQGKANQAYSMADDALTATRTNATNINTLKTDVNALKAVDESIWTNLDTINRTASAAKTKAEEGVAKADNALTATRTNATNINTLQTDVNALKAVDTSLSTRIDNVDSKASAAKTKAEEGVAKADNALARNIFTDEEKAKLANITNPMIIKGRVDTVGDLPTEAEIGWFYFVGLESASSYEEYCYSENGWEYIGLSQEGVDLSNYYTKKQVDTTVNELKAVDNSLGTRIDNVDSKASTAKTKAEEGVAKADNALAATRTNATNINSLQTDVNSLNTDVNALKTVDTSLGKRIDSVDTKASTAKTKAEEGVAKADNALTATRTNATNISTHETRLDSIDNTLSSHDTRITTAQQKANSVDEKVDATNKVVGQLSTSLQSAYNKINAHANDIAINRTTLGTQCKNLLKNTAATTTLNGVTFTINDDKSVTVNGTATAQISFVINNKVGLDIGNYILTGCPSGGSWNTFYLTAYASSEWLSAPDFGSGCRIENKTVTQVVISIASGYTANNLKFYPMLRDADITDGTYEPYKENIDERLIQNKSDIALNKSTLGYQCKNLLKLTLTTTTVSGITFTVNDDYSITLNGTATAIIWLQVGYTKGEHFRKEKLIFTGNPSGTGSGNGLEAWYLNSTTGNKYVSIANGNILTESEYDSSGVIIYEFHIDQGRTYNNVTYYPMLRYADVTDDTYEPYKESVDERLIQNKSDIAINRTTLGTQCKNLFNPNAVNWYQPTKTSIAKDGTITSTTTSDSRNWGYENAEYFLTLSAGKYIVSTVTETIDNTASNFMNIRGYNESGTQLFNIYPNTIGTKTISFTLTETATIAIMFKLFTQTCKIMIRDADILDDTYEPYKESVDERLIQNKSDIAVNKSTLGYQCKNLLNETEYLSSITSVSIGTFNISGNSITLTATGKDCYTKPHTSSDGGYRIPVEPDTDYILSWESDNTYAGLVYVFMNGNLSQQKLANNKDTKYIKFTTNSNTTFITIRLGVATSGNSITYSNIMLRYADILDDTYEPYQPSLVDRCLLKDTAGINLGHVQSSSITIDNLSSYTALWVNVSGGVSGINFATNLIVPIAYLAKNSSNRVSLAGGIPSSAYVTSEGPVAAKYMDGTITAKVSGNTLDLTISDGTIGSIEVISLM